MPLLSVVIATHNRSGYAVHAIRSVLDLKSPDIEVVVTDTSDTLDLADHLAAPSGMLKDPSLRYAKLSGPSSLTQNYNNALSLARGDYVCLIGDDDGLTRAAIDAARWASTHRVPVVSQTLKSIYAWPDFRARLTSGRHAGRLYVPRSAGSARWRDARADLSAALARALQGTDGLPRCYHGVVRRDLFEEIKARTGAYFHGSSPDMAGAVGLACVVERYCEVDLPLTVSGISSGSNSGRSALNTHKGDLASETQTSAYSGAGWVEGVPRVFAVETVWAHAGLTTLQALRPDTVGEFDYARLLGVCLERHPDFITAIDAATRELDPDGRLCLKERVAREKLKERLRRLGYLARRLAWPTAARGRRYFAGLSTVAEASSCYDRYAAERRLHFPTAVHSLPALVEAA